jgi:mannose-6-phosphate isomerase-like protein (cupin superfamily)
MKPGATSATSLCDELHRDHTYGDKPVLPPVLALSGSSSLAVSVHEFRIAEVRDQLEAGDGGYEIVHQSPGLELGVYVLIAPEPDRQQPHADDEVYIVLGGSGVLEVEGKAVPVQEGSAVFVEAGADHRFTSYEHLSVLVIFDRRPNEPA